MQRAHGVCASDREDESVSAMLEAFAASENVLRSPEMTVDGQDAAALGVLVSMFTGEVVRKR